MKHSVAPDEQREQAALYALGALGPEEAREFDEHLAEGCQACRAELDSFKAVAGALAFAAPEQNVSVGVRERLLRRLGPERKAGIGDGSIPGSSPLVSIRWDDLEWTSAGEGIFVKRLFVNEEGTSATSLVRMLPGARLPAHRHREVEQLFVLEGECRVEGTVLEKGDYHRAAAGTAHGVTWTERGTVFLLVASPDYDVLELD